MIDIQSAAWVPDDDPARDWDTATAFATTWTLQQATASGRRCVLVTNTQRNDITGLTRFLAHAVQVTPRSKVSGTGYAVLAYVPYEESLARAMQLARGGSLAVVESVGMPVHGWARMLAATNLVTGVPTEPFGDDVGKDLDRLMFHGSNGWTGGFGNDVSLRILRDLRTRGFDDAGAVVGVAAASGKSADAMKRLRTLAVKAGFTAREE